jgi:hypothetical protein
VDSTARPALLVSSLDARAARYPRFDSLPLRRPIRTLLEEVGEDLQGLRPVNN